MVILPILFLVLCGVAFIAGVLLNSYVLFVAGCRVERTTSTVWFWNRAMADLIFIIFLPLKFTSTFFLDLDWAKRLSSTVTSLYMFSSAFLLMALSVDRCILVARPEWAQNHRTPLLAVMMVCGIWALSLGFSLRYGDLWEYLLSPVSTSMNFQLDEGRVKAAVVIQFLVGFLIPLALILIPTFYIVLAAKLRGNRLIRSTKPLKILLGLIPTFFLCWLPYHIFSFLQISIIYPLPFLVTESIFAWMLEYFNSCLNPIFYLTMEEEFLRYRQHARNFQTTDNSGPELA
ncbi:C3a anaphylatoxin chemotactic receptor-like [Malaclemys terrapin pileata]|uniref:C3a anaphylatoxin chemotactic receptor-like n=1 Tax=Malaclemys terrapin pileata TaxID=2991368 RepID=UPI0023A79311|nr:C3a anaphylatoxin chemotactic receptor-like [Malaclemys terrapin pileata]